MVVLSKIYTRTGDTGQTALGNGDRVPKFDLRVAAYGTVDETNATLGMARLHGGALDDSLARVSNDLFDLGADLCTPDIENDATAPYPRLRIIAAQVDRLEAEIDAMNADMAALTSFILPGGSPLAATLHVARAVARRAERSLVSARRDMPINPEAQRYVNRLSDWLFVAARHANEKGAGDILWVPGGSR